MSRTCQFTGKKTATGKNVSHSKRRTLREFRPNLFMRNIKDPISGKTYRLKLSAKAIKTMKKIGVQSFLAKLRKMKEII